MASPGLLVSRRGAAVRGRSGGTEENSREHCGRDTIDFQPGAEEPLCSFEVGCLLGRAPGSPMTDTASSGSVAVAVYRLIPAQR